MPIVIGGRYGLSSKEFTPGMVAGVFEELAREQPKRRFTIGINDDVSATSLPYDASLDIEPEETVRAVFFGLGSDGTVGANKNTIKILGDAANLHAQGYFVYDSKKSGSQTVSHLRFGPRSIRAPYLVSAASFVGCHQFGLIERSEVLDRAAQGATLLLNCPEEPDRVWDALSRPVQEKILAKQIKLYAIDAGKIAREAGLGRRTNTVLQTCFFAISGVLEREQAIAAIKASIEKTYGKRGAEVVKRNIEAVDRSIAALHRGRRPRPGLVHAGGARARARGRSRVRAHRDRGDDGRPRRSAARERAAGRRHVSERHDQVREAQRLGHRRGLGFRALHPVRQLQLRLPAQRDPLPLLRAGPPGRRARRLPVGAAERRRAAGRAVHAAGVRRGLHRLRAVRRGLSGVGGRRAGPQGDQPRRAWSRCWPASGRTSPSSSSCR